MQQPFRVIRNSAVGLLGVIVFVTGFVGFMHTRAGHPLLMRLAGLAGCPMGKANGADVEVVRLAGAARERGAQPAPARPALGFLLDQSTLADVRNWMERVGAACTEERQGTLVKCGELPAIAIGRPAWEKAITEVSFGFTPGGQLVTVTALYSHRTAEDSANIADTAKATLERELGPAHRAAGTLVEKGSVATLSIATATTPWM